MFPGAVPLIGRPQSAGTLGLRRRLLVPMLAILAWLELAYCFVGIFVGGLMISGTLVIPAGVPRTIPLNDKSVFK